MAKKTRKLTDIRTAMKDRNVSKNERSWRLVHDGKKVLNLFEIGGYTITKHTLLEFSTEAEAMAEIKRLGLLYEPESAEDHLEKRQLIDEKIKEKFEEKSK